MQQQIRASRILHVPWLLIAIAVVLVTAFALTPIRPATAQPAQSQHLSASTSPNGDVLVSWRNTPGNAQDWVSVVHAGLPDDQYEGTWTYTGGQVSGTYNAGRLEAGLYEARLYLDWPAGGYRVADRLAFRVGGATPGGTFESRNLIVTVSGARDVVVTWRDTPGNAQDWVSVVHAGLPDDQYEGTWTYTGGQRSGNHSFGQFAPGTYEVRLYLDWPAGGYQVADRVIFSVGAGAGGGVFESTSLQVMVTAERDVTVVWRNTPGNAQDWVAVVQAGAADDQYGGWTYTGGQRSGAFHAGKLDPGEYEARLYLDWPAGGYRVADRVRFRVN